MEQKEPAVGAPLQREVRPVAYLHTEFPGNEWVLLAEDNVGNCAKCEPLFTRQQVEAEVAAERERWRAAAQVADDALTHAYCGEPLPTMERRALELLRALLGGPNDRAMRRDAAGGTSV